ncbi:VPLPA-CTERM sorting domain-containing protein [Poseidonocella sedimentorum]|uniref:VPLPA-CTERM protein sorting domain-containing protein n=1 Tax=Poseidonocella sedimentorum TaxID=871652 RepID=A0A1I6DLH6_9RHOB|nr:VPLPA-CTERM sorting domain-containing protein [Poseidonocella sedimentorum]SFR06274.1 VPLPA-CTERM protein sorting domain-containing protein [Poseidonocella sedimentorum]
MKHSITAAIMAAGLAFGAGGAFAATLGLTTAAPSLSSSTGLISYFDVDPDGDLSTGGAEVDATDGVSPSGFTEIGFGVGFSLADPTTGLTGGFDVFDDDGLFLGGDLFAVGFTEDVIELHFNNLSGSGASAFGTSVLALIVFDDPLGANPFAALLDGDELGASITISDVVAPIPLPAGLPLLLAGLLGLGLVRRSGAG